MRRGLEWLGDLTRAPLCLCVSVVKDTPSFTSPEVDPGAYDPVNALGRRSNTDLTPSAKSLVARSQVCSFCS